MTKKEKLLAKAFNNPNGLRLAELELLMRNFDWILDHQTGSHRIWKSPHGFRLPIQPKADKAKGYQVKQFLTQVEKENDDV